MFYKRLCRKSQRMLFLALFFISMFLFNADKGVLWWEIFNEPSVGNKYSVSLRKAGYQWAKEVQPPQPVLNCWDDNEVTDIVDAHNYVWIPSKWDQQMNINSKKGTVLTEAGARWYAPGKSNGEPCGLIGRPGDDCWG